MVTILEEAQKLVDGDRNDAYGHPHVNLGRIAGLWSAYVGIELSRDDVSMMMMLVKISRHRHQPKRDNLVDIAGYARIAEVATERRDIPTSTDASAQLDMSDDKKTCPQVGDVVIVNGIEMTLTRYYGEYFGDPTFDAVPVDGGEVCSIYWKDCKWCYSFDHNADENAHA